MLSTGPYALTAGTPLVVDDPLAGIGSASVGVQVQNQSPFVLNVLAAGEVSVVQAFAAVSIPTHCGGQSIKITPAVVNASIVTANETNAVTLVWLGGYPEHAPGGYRLNDGWTSEPPPMEDGPLAAAAVSVTVQSPSKQSILSATNNLVNTSRITMTGSAIQLTGTGNPLYGEVFKAESTNAGLIYVGGSSVSTNSFSLAAGETLNLSPVSPIGTLWVLGTAPDILDVFAL